MILCAMLLYSREQGLDLSGSGRGHMEYFLNVVINVQVL
jgi:hypothetical protein